MTPRELQDLLRDLLEELSLDRDDEDDMSCDCGFAEFAERTVGIRQIHTYEDAGVLTTDKGFIVELEDGGELQVTIARSA